MYRVNNSKHPGIFVLFVARIIHNVNAYEDPRAHKREGAKNEMNTKNKTTHGYLVNIIVAVEVCPLPPANHQRDIVPK